MVAGPSTIVTSATLQHRVSSGTDVGCSGVVAAAAVAAAAAAAEDSKHSGTTSSDAGVEPYKFLAVHEVPEWLRNPHQHQGYRAPHLSFAQCCMTGLMLHNESWSIWSALVVFVTFLAAIPFVATRPELLGNHSVDDKVVFTLGLLSAAIGAFNSFVFHLFLCMSPRIKAVLAYLDYMGIFCIASGTSLVTVHWVFRCYPQTRFAWTVVCGIYFVATVPVACSDRVRLNRPLRICIFLSSILTAAVFDLYSAAMLGTDSPLWQAAVWVQVRFFARLSPGVFFYITRIPERWFPIVFDNWFHSHVLWHFFGGYAGYLLYFDLFDFVKLSSAMPCVQ